MNYKFNRRRKALSLRAQWNYLPLHTNYIASGKANDRSHTEFTKAQKLRDCAEN